jgi:translation initiation factor 2 beta subunit (eIF-2beta)/eIF-5
MATKDGKVNSSTDHAIDVGLDEDQLDHDNEQLFERLKELEMAAERRAKLDENEMLRKRIEEMEQSASGEHKSSSTAPGGSRSTGSDPDGLHRWLRREFQIQGQIGRPGEKDKLSFASLIHQIDIGLEKDYEEKEVIAAVVKAITAGSTFRSYLEGKKELGLDNLRRVLRTYFNEKEPTALYKELVNITQLPQETAQDFIFRAMDLRQKVCFASNEVDSSLVYDPKLVKNMFLHAVATGLQNDNIRMEMKMPLENADTTDEKLLEALYKAQSSEQERQAKASSAKEPGGSTSTTKHVKANAVGADALKPSYQSKTDSDLKQLKADMKQMTALMTEMRTEMQNHNRTTEQKEDSSKESRPKKPFQKGCSVCKEIGKGDECDHCWKCGSREHFARGCKGNSNGPTQRDRR